MATTTYILDLKNDRTDPYAKGDWSFAVALSDAEKRAMVIELSAAKKAKLIHDYSLTLPDLPGTFEQARKTVDTFIKRGR